MHTEPQQHPQQQFQQLQIAQQNTIELTISQVFTTLNNAYNSSKSTLKQIATNVAYNVKHSSCPFVNRKQIVLKSGEEKAAMLGRVYGYEDRERFYSDFHGVIWICYRSKLEDKFGDVGWGCMIRVCQMVLAQALRRCQPNRHNSEIIREFSTEQNALFSFDRICMEGKIMKRWTSSAQIMIAIQDLLRQQSKYHLKIQMYNIECSLDDIEPQQNYPLLLIVNNRVSTSTIEQKMRDHLYEMLRHPNSIGMISGIGGEAIYIAGYYEDQLIALDPHFVQSEDEGEKIYFNQVPRGVTLNKLVPAAGFCFLFHSAEQHEKWVADLAESWYFHQPNVVIECPAEYSKKIYEERHPKKMGDGDGSDQFQLLQ